MNRKSIMATAMMAAAMSIGMDNLLPKKYSSYTRRRDELPKDVQAEKIRKAKEKRDRKANK